MPQTIVITGSNRGIGLELVRHYVKQGDRVFALCRKPSQELQDSGATVVDNVDVSDAGSIEAAVQKIEAEHVDVLINNAGILERTALEPLDFESIERQFQVNTLGPLRVTEAFLPKLGEGSRIGLVTSRMGSIDDNTSGGSYGYRMSKCALNMAGVSLAQDLKPKGIAVALIHPGFVQTDMVGGMGDVPPEVAAERIAQRITELNLENSGTFWHANGDVLPW